jgi:hypothetical protein
MKVDIYELKKKRRTLLVMPHGMNPGGIPPAVLQETGAAHFVKTVELEAGQVGNDAAAVQKDLETNGYALVAARVRFQEKSPTKA